MTSGQDEFRNQTGALAQPGSDGRSVKSAERVLDLLEYLVAQPRGGNFSQMLRDLDIPKSSLHALLTVLERRGYLEIDPQSRCISLGLRNLALGQAYINAQDLIATAQRALQALVATVNETAQLAQLSSTENIYLAKVDSSHTLRLQSQPGIRLPAHATGVGKAILAQRPTDEVAALYPGENLPVFAANTLASPAALQAELARIRQRGFAIDNEEYTPGVFCLAVPLSEPGKPVSCGVSVSMPISRCSEALLQRILPELARCALEISLRLGAAPPNAELSHLADPTESAARLRALFEGSPERFAFL